MELVKAGQVDDAKRVLTAALELDPDLRLVRGIAFSRPAICLG